MMPGSSASTDRLTFKQLTCGCAI